jgi:DNA polymerase-4
MSPRPTRSAPVGYAEVADFHVAVARRSRPEVASAPLIVGGDPAKRGRVVGLTPELRALGVEEGMGVAEALARAPAAHWVRTDMQRAREMSGHLRAAVRREIGAVETSGLAAFYFRAPSDREEARALAQRLVELVERETDLALRVGIAPARFAAPLVAEDVGARGVGVLASEEFEAFLAALPVDRLPAVGPKTTTRLLELGVQTVAGLRELGAERLELLLGNAGRSLWLLAGGEDPKPLRVRRHPMTLSREEKLIGGDSGPSALDVSIARLSTRLEQALRRDGLWAGRIALRLTSSDARSQTRSRALWPPATSAADIAIAARGLLERADAEPGALRRIGIVLKGLEIAGAEDRQLDLF